MEQNNLDILASELHLVSVSSQETKVGGFDYSIDLPSVIITPESMPSFDWPSWEPGGDNSYDSSYSGGGDIPPNNGNNNSNNNTKPSGVSDPEKLLDGTKNFLKSTIDALKGLIENKTAPAGSEEYLSALESAQDTLDKMEKSTDQKFRIEEISNNGDKFLDANISYDKETKEIVFSIENISGVYGYELVAHELTHIEQLMNGELKIEDGQIVGYDINDEVEAYQRQHDIFYGSQSGNFDMNGKAYPDGDYKVTPEDIYNKYPGIYNDLPEQNLNKPNGGSEESVSEPSTASTSSAS